MIDPYIGDPGDETTHDPEGLAEQTFGGAEEHLVALAPSLPIELYYDIDGGVDKLDWVLK